MLCVVGVVLLVFAGTCISWPQPCTYVFYNQPVCGSDGKTYINFGHLTCEALKNSELHMVHEGACAVVTTDNPFAELDQENETISLHGSNLTFDDLTASLAKLNISVEEMKATLAELNMTLADLNVSSSYLQNPQTDQEYREGGRYYGQRHYDRYGRPYGYGYDSDEFGDFSLEFGFGHSKVSRIIMAAAIAGAIKHQMDKSHKAKYGGSKYGGGGHKQPMVFAGSSIGAPPSYGFKPSVVNPPTHIRPLGSKQPVDYMGGGSQPVAGGYPKQPSGGPSPPKPVLGGYPKQTGVVPVNNGYPKQTGSGGVKPPPPYTPYQPPPSAPKGKGHSNTKAKPKTRKNKG